VNNIFLRATTLLALPLVVFVIGAWIMSKMANREYVTRRLGEVVAPEDAKPLNQRFGYDLAVVERHWGGLDETARASEKRFLELDLVFPFLYGAALAASLLMAWASLGRPFNAAWLITSVAITLIADWTENLVQLSQLRRYVNGIALESGWIQIASIATILKLSFFVCSSGILIALVGCMIVAAIRSA
jgi:hypothetical protein